MEQEGGGWRRRMEEEHGGVSRLQKVIKESQAKSGGSARWPSVNVSVLKPPAPFSIAVFVKSRVKSTPCQVSPIDSSWLRQSPRSHSVAPSFAMGKRMF